MNTPFDDRHPVGPRERGPTYSGLEFEDDALVVLYTYLVNTEGSAAVDMHKLLRSPYGRVPTAAARVRYIFIIHMYIYSHICAPFYETYSFIGNNSKALNCIQLFRGFADKADVQRRENTGTQNVWAHRFCTYLAIYIYKYVVGDAAHLLQPGGGCSSFGRAITEDGPTDFIFGPVG